MGRPQDSGTRVSLLGRLRRDPGNQAAWDAFVEHYGGRIYEWCRRWDLQEADAQDVTQNVLLKLAEKMRDFDYDPSRSFRAWLKTLTHHAWIDYVEGLKARGRGGDDSQVIAVLEQVEARDDLVRRLEAEFDQELLEAAMERVRARVEPQTWEAFRLTSIEGLSGGEAARRIPMKEPMVYVARGRVLKLLRQEVKKLNGEDP